MAFDFPNSPTVDQVYNSPITGVAYTWDGQKWGPGPTGSGSGSTSVTISDTPPASPSAGNLWWESDTGNIYIYYADANSSQWVMIVAGAPLNTNPARHGQCRLVCVTGGASVALMPFNGNILTVNGVNCTIPAAGVSLAVTGLIAATLYRIYAVATAGVVTSLEASTTAHATSATPGNVGVEIKSGDDTRSFVGLAYVSAGPTFGDAPATRYTRSWFNRQRMTIRGSTRGANTGITGTVADLGSAMWCGFVCFADDALQFTGYAMYFATVAGTVSFYIGYDGVATGNPAVVNTTTTASVLPSPVGDSTVLTEGIHTVGLMGSASGTCSLYTASYIAGAIG